MNGACGDQKVFLTISLIYIHIRTTSLSDYSVTPSLETYCTVLLVPILFRVGSHSSLNYRKMVPLSDGIGMAIPSEKTIQFSMLTYTLIIPPLRMDAYGLYRKVIFRELKRHRERLKRVKQILIVPMLCLLRWNQVTFYFTIPKSCTVAKSTQATHYDVSFISTSEHHDGMSVTSGGKLNF